MKPKLTVSKFKSNLDELVNPGHGFDVNPQDTTLVRLKLIDKENGLAYETCVNLMTFEDGKLCIVYEYLDKLMLTYLEDLNSEIKNKLNS